MISAPRLTPSSDGLIQRQSRLSLDCLYYGSILSDSRRTLRTQLSDCFFRIEKEIISFSVKQLPLGKTKPETDEKSNRPLIYLFIICIHYFFLFTQISSYTRKQETGSTCCHV